MDAKISESAKDWQAYVKVSSEVHDLKGILPREEAEGHLRVLHNYYRLICLNKLYYGSKLEWDKKINMIFELIIAVGATSSGIAGWAIWQSKIGGVAWALIAGLSALFAIAKPLVNLTGSIERYSKLYGEYATVFDKIKLIEDKIWANDGISQQDIDSYYEVRNRTSELRSQEDANPKRSYVLRLQAIVNKQIPPESLWMPDK